jgi:hypothetical protein
MAAKFNYFYQLAKKFIIKNERDFFSYLLMTLLKTFYKTKKNATTRTLAQSYFTNTPLDEINIAKD